MRFGRQGRRQVEAYDTGRACADHRSICNAPVTNMYFNALGRVAPCWTEMGGWADVWSRERSILDIWNGDLFTRRRRDLAARRFAEACVHCHRQIVEGIDPLAAVYDRTEPDPSGLPNSFELELSNLCNFECVMCHGELSSKIRRNRDRLPPIVSPYDERFVEQITELLPTTRDLRFSGGEPMMHPIVHQIVDRIAELRPDLPVGVSTNGSVLNDAVRRMLDRVDVRMFLSFESLRPDRYESIRVGSDFGVLMSNIDHFIDHFAGGRGWLIVNTNPMRMNWDEMADLARWCTHRGVGFALNTVVQPAGLSLATLPRRELLEIHEQLASETFVRDDDEDQELFDTNVAQFQRLVAQVAAWADAAADSPSEGVGVAAPRRR